MNRKVYEKHCLLRKPEVRAEFGRLLAANPKVKAIYLWRFMGQGTPSGLGPDDPELKAFEAFNAKYPGVDDLGEIGMSFQPYPLLFDPAWKVAVDQAQGQFISRTGSAARGLVTRTNVESDGGRTGAEEVHLNAREIFGQMDEYLRTVWRQFYGPASFRDDRVFLPIGPDTTLDQVRRLWPIIRRAQQACYGERPKRKATRRNIYEQRIVAWDLVREGRLRPKVAARQVQLPLRTFCRRFYEAQRDIEGVGGKPSPETAANHVAVCPTCQEAEAKGTSDLYCRWMQRQVGPRSSQIKGALSSQTKEGKTALEMEERKQARLWRPS